MTIVALALAIAACIGWTAHTRVLRRALHEAWAEIDASNVERDADETANEDPGPRRRAQTKGDAVTADPLFRFAPTFGEVVSMRAFVWRSEPPVVDEVRACSWWWMRQRGEDGYTVPHACEIGWDEDGLFFAEPGCPRVVPEEYGDGVEWMPCMPPEIKPDSVVNTTEGRAMLAQRHYCPSCGASLISEPDGSRGAPGATSCCKRCGWHLVTLEAWRKLTPFRQGYLLYMQGAWPTSEIMDQPNPYAEGSDDWGAFRQGQQHAMSDMQDNKPSIAELTEGDIGTLERAADLRMRFDAGIFPSTIGQRSHFQKLVRRGLLEFDSWGRDIDGEVERDVEIYKLTTAGETLVAGTRVTKP